ncbi:MAG: ATP-binding protein [Acidimicrobiia bacterium]
MWRVMEILYSLKLPRDTATVPLVRTLCRDAMTRLGVTSSCRGDVALALTEACANVVRHAAGVTEYTVTVELGPEHCHIRVIDDGEGLGDTAVLAEMPDPDDDSGRGIALMSLLVDNVDFTSRPEDGTVVHLEKHLELEEGSLLRALA